MKSAEIKKKLKASHPFAKSIKWNSEFKFWEVLEDTISDNGFDAEKSIAYAMDDIGLRCLGSTICEN